MNRFRFFTTCVSAPARDIIALEDNRQEITRRTFLKYVDRDSLRDLEASLGYATHPRQGLIMARDWFKGLFQGKPCVEVLWSQIDHIFV